MLWLDTLRLHRRGLIVGGALAAAVLVLLGAAAVAARLTSGGGAPARRAAVSGPTSSAPAPLHSAASPMPAATDVASWDAIAPVQPAVSAGYPAIQGDATRDPYAYARAFATELFNRDYAASSRADLVAWAQYEDSPLQSPNYPRSDWAKVLVDSLTDPTWDGATDTPVPADGPWLALRAERATDAVSQVHVSPDPVWQQRIANGYQPPDRFATDLDVTLTITRRVTVAGRTTATRYAVALALQLGTAANGAGYGVAATNNYVIKEVS